MKLNKNLNYNQKNAISLSISLIILIVILYFFVFSYMKSVQKAHGMLNEHRVSFETKLIKEEKFSKISKNLSKIESNIKEIDKAFIDQNKKLEFITMLEGLAERNDTSIEIRVDFSNIDKTDNSLPVSLSLVGSYNELINTLISLENLDYYININNVGIVNNRGAGSRAQALGNTPTTGNLTMTINALTYWR